MRSVFCTLVFTSLMALLPLGAQAQTAPDKNAAPSPQMQITKPIYPWKTEAQQTKDGKSFSHCMVKNMYDNGILLIMAENTKHQRRLALHFPQDKLQASESYPLQWQVDRQNAQPVTAVAASPRILAIAIDDAMTQQIARGNMLFLRGPNDTLMFDMRGVHDAVQSLTDCLTTHGVAPRKPVAFQAPPAPSMAADTVPAIPVMQTAPSPSSASVAPPASLSPAHRQMFANAGLPPQNIMTVPNAEQADKPFDLIWMNGPLFIGVKSEPPIPHQALTQTAAHFTEVLQQICGGKFLAEGGKVEKRGAFHVMPAEVACSPQNTTGKAAQNTVAALLFMLDTKSLKIFFIEAPDKQGAKAVQARDRLLQQIH